ncbi:S8 family serine peptidase [Brevibacillus sp. GCM10020057]|uniref:S8 family serine peptidase n=1 Tax=Brevibacillus sp. GCM10020057 TaxID=3317327 RepID=UPI00363126B6
MQSRWYAGLSAAVAFSLLVTAVPTEAKQWKERKGHIQIEAKTETAIDGATSKAADQSGLVVVQLSGPVREEWKEEIEDIGVTLGDYLPDFAFIAKLGRPQNKNKLLKLPFVEKVTPFAPVSKVPSSLRSALGKEKAVDVAVIGFDDSVNMRRTMDSLAEQSVQEVRTLAQSKHISIATMSGQAVEKLIQSDDVIAVVPVPENELRNDVAATIIHADELAGTGYDGAGEIIGVADTGLDTGTKASLHPDFQGQVKNIHALGRPDDARDLHGHGTHVAGSILGTGAASDGQYKGMAPGARLVFHAIEDADKDLVTDVRTILKEAYEDGARIHSDSWGADDEGEYSYTSYLFDKFLWDHPDMTALVAAGNVGDEGYQTIGSPATAKNVIAVGATENERPRFGSQSDDEDDVWKYSSRGLTADGRIKPDLVAPGTSILSTRSSLAPGKNFDQTVGDRYAYMTGTSMATAIMAGGAAQVRQYLREQGETKPSAALLKAILLGSADELGADMRLQGYGRANLLSAIHTSYKDETNGLKTQDKKTYFVKVSDDSKPLSITLAWTDYPASLAAERALVNDLNLTVTTPDGKRLNGNDFFEAPYDDQVDNLNNVEQIWIEKPPKGVYTVTVQGYNIPKGPQPYAIATTGQWSEEEPAPPEQEFMKESMYRATLTKKKPYREYTIRLRRAGEVSVSATWEGSSDVNLAIYNNQEEEVASARTKANPEELKVYIPENGLYKVRVELKKGGDTPVKMTVRYPGK